MEKEQNHGVHTLPDKRFEVAVFMTLECIRLYVVLMGRTNKHAHTQTHIHLPSDHSASKATLCGKVGCIVYYLYMETIYHRHTAHTRTHTLLMSSVSVEPINLHPPANNCWLQLQEQE